MKLSLIFLLTTLFISCINSNDTPEESLSSSGIIGSSSTNTISSSIEISSSSMNSSSSYFQDLIRTYFCACRYYENDVVFTLECPDIYSSAYREKTTTFEGIFEDIKILDTNLETTVEFYVLPSDYLGSTPDSDGVIWERYSYLANSGEIVNLELNEVNFKVATTNLKLGYRCEAY